MQEVLVNADTNNKIDTTAMDVLIKLHLELVNWGVVLALAHVKDPVRDKLRLVGAEAAIGRERFYDSIADGMWPFTQGCLRYLSRVKAIWSAPPAEQTQPLDNNN